MTKIILFSQKLFVLGLFKIAVIKKNSLGLDRLVWFSLVWFGLVWLHINHCRLFNAKSIFMHINSSILNNSV